MGDVFWTAAFLNERFPAPVSPLGWSVIGPLLDDLALRDPLRWMGYTAAGTIPLTRLYRSHPYANVAVFEILYKPFPDSLLPEDAARYFPGGDASRRTRAPYPTSILQPRFLLSLAFHALRDLPTASPLNFWKWQRYVPRHERDVAVLGQELESVGDAPGAAALLLNIILRSEAVHRHLLRIHRWSLTYADLLYKILIQAVGPARAEALTAHTDNKTVQVNRALEGLARWGEACPAFGETKTWVEVQTDPECRHFAQAMERFLDVHGHRSPSLDIAHATWRERPEEVLELIREMQNGNRRREVQSGRLPGLYGRATPLVWLTRKYIVLREDQRYYWQKSLAVTRRAYLYLARLWHARGVLEAPGDVFFAEQDEIRAVIRGDDDARVLRENIRARRRAWAEYEAEFRLSPARAYPLFLRGELPLDRAPHAENVWRGHGVSPGRARGRVRLARRYVELERVQAGEILIAPSTDPAWTPVFARLGGLVLEWGGILSHGAVVAREYGLPAVAGLPGITDELHDGEEIELDGGTGTVRRL